MLCPGRFILVESVDEELVFKDGQMLDYFLVISFLWISGFERFIELC